MPLITGFFRLIRLPPWGSPDKSGITQVVLAASSRESKPEDISFCHCGVERETAMMGKEVRGGADVDHNDE